MTRRPRIEHEIDGTRWTLFDAWRAPGGLGLGYFVAADDAPDRRVALEPGTDVTDLDRAAFRELRETAAGLTDTERRIAGPGGRPWLAQAYGPVWHEGGTAREVIGVRLRCLSDEEPVAVLRGVPLAELSDDELSTAIDQPDQ